MKRIALFAAAALSLAGCATMSVPSIPPAPSAVADKTVLDERAANAVEKLYKAARFAVETAVDAGFLKGAAAARVADLDRKAFRAVGKVRAAYRVGNATSYKAAYDEAIALVSNLLNFN